MKILLALDCSTARGGVALGIREFAEPPVEHWHREFHAGRGHGGRMFAALEEAMTIVRDFQRFGNCFEGIVVGLGPGSYSGVRQSIAAAFGLSIATGAALRGVPSPLALADAGNAFIAIGDARRGTFYFTVVNEGRCVAHPLLLENRAELEAHLAAHPGLPVRIVETPLPDALLPDAAICFPAAARLLYAVADTPVVPPLEPIYLRPVSITLPKSGKPTAP